METIDLKNVAAMNSTAIAHGGEKVPLLGHLVFFTIKESRVPPHGLKKLFAQIGLVSTDLLG